MVHNTAVHILSARSSSLTRCWTKTESGQLRGYNNDKPNFTAIEKHKNQNNEISWL